MMRGGLPPQMSFGRVTPGKRKDLAAGAGGDYRYVVTNHDQHQVPKVRGATLMRSPDKALSVEQQEAMLGKGW